MKTRVLRLTLIAALLLPLWLANPLQPAPSVSAQSAAEIISLVNDLRASLGLPGFSLNGALMVAAQSHAEWMAANMAYTHTGANGTRPQQRASAAGYAGYVSENIVGGTNMSPRQGVVWWENSAIHYQTMTSTRHIHVGAGYATANGQNMYVLVIGVPSDYAPAPGTSAAAELQAEAPVIVIPVTKAEPREDGAIVHQVQMGQTAWDVAAVYDVELRTLLRLNNLPDDPILFPGDELYVRPPDGATLPPADPLTHTVQEGQSAWSIAARYNLSLGELLDLNGLPQGALLQPGEQIIIRLAAGQSPPPTRTPTPLPTTHRVQEGDSLWSIAIRYDLAIDDLLGLNGLTMESVIVPGDELVIRQVTPTIPPTLTPPATPTFAAIVAAAPTATPTPTPITGELGPAVTVVSEATPIPRATATLLPTLPLPTENPAPPPASTGRMRNIVIGAAVIGLGLLALAGMAAVELYDRLNKRG